MPKGSSWKPSKETVRIGVIAAIVGMVLLLVVELWRRKAPLKEGINGFGIGSGLNFNNNPKYCWKNPYDPPDAPGYCSGIGRVVI